MNRVSVRHPYLEKSAWLWRVKDSLLVLLLVQHTITRSAQIQKPALPWKCEYFGQFNASSILLPLQLPYQAGW